MSESITDKKSTSTKNKVCMGIDLGTMYIVVSRSDSKQTKITRNVFLRLDPEEVNISEMSNISYVQSEDGKELFIVGQDAFQFANIFNKEVSRPMKSGLISPDEIDAIDVLTLMIKSLLGNVKNKDVYCSYSVPAEAIDEGRSVTYHERVFGRILNSIGVNHTPVNEAMAIIFSECAKEKFSGIALSFGAGMCNTCIAYKGIEALTFSTARSGDWIDRNVAESLNMIPNRVTSIKEKHLDLQQGFTSIKNKKTKRIVEALEYYYEALVTYTIKRIINEFEEKVEIEIDESIPIVISGGTSMPKGFLRLFSETIKRYELPFEVSTVRMAKNPMTAVSNGLLVKTMSDLS